MNMKKAQVIWILTISISMSACNDSKNSSTATQTRPPSGQQGDGKKGGAPEGPLANSPTQPDWVNFAKTEGILIQFSSGLRNLINANPDSSGMGVLKGQFFVNYNRPNQDYNSAICFFVRTQPINQRPYLVDPDSIVSVSENHFKFILGEALELDCTGASATMPAPLDLSALKTIFGNQAEVRVGGLPKPTMSRTDETGRRIINISCSPEDPNGYNLLGKFHFPVMIDLDLTLDSPTTEIKNIASGKECVTSSVRTLNVKKLYSRIVSGRKSNLVEERQDYGEKIMNQKFTGRVEFCPKKIGTRAAISTYLEISTSGRIEYLDLVIAPYAQRGHQLPGAKMRVIEKSTTGQNSLTTWDMMSESSLYGRTQLVECAVSQ